MRTIGSWTTGALPATLPPVAVAPFLLLPAHTPREAEQRQRGGRGELLFKPLSHCGQ